MYTKRADTALESARERGVRVMVLAGRPYHTDSEIGHGIDRLANSLGFAVVSEDSVSDLTECPGGKRPQISGRITRAFTGCRVLPPSTTTCQLVQLVSFGCGVDAITTDEVRQVIRGRGKLYTQLKIDEITNLGAVKSGCGRLSAR